MILTKSQCKRLAGASASLAQDCQDAAENEKDPATADRLSICAAQYQEDAEWFRGLARS